MRSPLLWQYLGFFSLICNYRRYASEIYTLIAAASISTSHNHTQHHCFCEELTWVCLHFCTPIWRRSNGCQDFCHVSENDLYTPETSCMKRTSVHIKNAWIKQFCNPKVRDFATAFRARQVSGPFEKQAIGLYLDEPLLVLSSGREELYWNYFMSYEKWRGLHFLRRSSFS